jgi:plasmid segregation protein ParM
MTTKGKGTRMAKTNTEAASQAAAPIKFVGVDDGHYAVKVVTDDGQMFSIPSRARSGKHLIAWQGPSDSDGGIYRTEEGGLYTVHEHLNDEEDTRFRDYPTSQLNRVLVHHALRRAGLAGQHVNICTGLPVSYYYIGGEKNQALIDGKEQNLRKGVTAEHGECAIIDDNTVTTEAIAAYFDQIMNMDGTETSVCGEVEHASVGVVDVGGKTTDSVVVLPGGMQIDNARSGSTDIGVLKLNDTIDAALRTKFKFDMVPKSMTESAIATNTIKVYGKVEDVTSIVREAKAELAEGILSNVRTKIGSGRDLEWVLFVGGGSIVMREQLASHFPHARFPDRPEMANARGMFKIAKYIFGAGA